MFYEIFSRMPPRPVLGVLIACASCYALAQPFEVEEMQPLLEQGQQLAGCLAQVDQATIDSLRAEGEALARRVESLCHSGHAPEAQAEAAEFADRVLSSPAAAQMRDCAPALALFAPMLAEMAHGPNSPIDVCAEHLMP